MRKGGRPAVIPSRAVWASLGTALVILGCGGTRAAARGATVLYASGADLQSINPLFTVHPLAKQVQKHVLFLTLVGYDSSLHPVPRLARFAWARDRRSIDFFLRPDVRWHDSIATTGADVVWTLAMAREPAVAYPRARDLDPIAGVELVDSQTVRVRWSRTLPTFPDVLADLPILPAHRFAGLKPDQLRRAAFNQTPVGNGPFRFISHQANQRWVFARDSGFPEQLGRPAIERLVVVVVDEASTKLAALTSGELDFAGINPAHAAFVRRDPRLAVVDYPVQLVYGVVWNLRRPMFQDLRVRQALSRAIDRPTVVAAYAYGFATPAAGPVAPIHPWAAALPEIPYDSGAAARLLDQAGWRRGPDGVRAREGQRLAFELLSVPTADNALEQMLQAAWRKLGVEVRLRQLELSTFLGVAQGAPRAFDAILTGLPGDLSLGYVRALFDGRRPGPLAYAGYQSPAFDASMNRVDAAATETELAEAWRTAQRVLEADEPTAWLYHARGVQGVNRRVRDVVIDLRGELQGVSAWRVTP